MRLTFSLCRFLAKLRVEWKRWSGHDLEVTVRPLVRSDFGFALDLASREHWDYDLIDLERLFRLFPEGCLVAEYGGVRAGWVLVSTYESLAWIGSLVVQDRLRGKGIGAALLDHALGYVRRLGVKTVGLYSYSESVGFYQRMGFKRDHDFERVEGEGGKRSPRGSMQQPRYIDEVVELDRKYFCGNRKLLLEALREEFPDLLITRGEKNTLGYIAGKSFSDGTAEIGPWVCDLTGIEAAEELFASELGQLFSRRVSLTIPSQNPEVHRIIRKFGFRIKQTVARMFAGDPADLPRIDGIYAAGGLDVG